MANRILVKCSVCKSDISITQDRQNRSKSGKFFCNKECKAAYFSGKNNPAFNSIEKTCDYCGKTMIATQSRLIRYKYIFCGSDCRDKFFKKQFVTVKCDYCGAEKQMLKSVASRAKNHFCDKACKGKWQSENLSGSNNPVYDKIIVRCSNCGKEKAVSKCIKANHKHFFCNKKCKGAWMSHSVVGEKNPCWKGGLTDKRRLARGKLEADVWRKQVFERDNYTCQFCGKHGGKLNAHHIVPVSIDCNKIYDINNGITLCVVCHKRAHGIGTIENRIFIGYRLKDASTSRIDKDYYQCINDVFLFKFNSMTQGEQ